MQIYRGRGKYKYSGSDQKARARAIVHMRIRRGKMERQPCEKCGDPQAQAHHRDYTKPLEITWLCKRCHRKHHIELEEQTVDELALGTDGDGSWITEKDFARTYKLSPRTLTNWRYRDRKEGRTEAAPGYPIYKYFGRSVRYFLPS